MKVWGSEISIDSKFTHPITRKTSDLVKDQTYRDANITSVIREVPPVFLGSKDTVKTIIGEREFWKEFNQCVSDSYYTTYISGANTLICGDSDIDFRVNIPHHSVQLMKELIAIKDEKTSTEKKTSPSAKK